MSIVMNMRWSGITKEQYEAARELVDWEGRPAAGGLFHIAAFDDKGLRVTDVWQNEESLMNFVSTRLMPGVVQLGVTSQPDVEVFPVHALFSPGFERKVAEAFA